MLWCKKGYFSSPFPQAKPRRVSLDISRLSLDQPSAPQPLRPRYRFCCPTVASGAHFYSWCWCFLCSNPPPPPVPPNKLSHRRHNLGKNDNSDKPADSSFPGINGGSALSVLPHALAAQSSSTRLSAALDGVPFSLHPKFDVQVNVTVGHAHADGPAPAGLPHPDLSAPLSGSEFSVKRHSHQVRPRH